MLNPGARPSSVVQSIYCHLMIGAGVLLMTIAAIPTVSSVLAGISYSSATYLGLLVLFAAGGAIFLRHDGWARSLDSASNAVPSLIYIFTIKTIGVLTAVFSGLSIILTLMLGGAEEGWWVTPLTLLLYGFVLFISTKPDDSPVPDFIRKIKFRFPKQLQRAKFAKAKK